MPGVDSATIIPPDGTAPTQKAYKYAFAGMQLQAGDFVYVIPISGTYVLLGGAVEGSGGGSLPPGGSAGQALIKTAAADYSAGWQFPQYRSINFLDNAVFEQIGGLPVNQRGQNSYLTAGEFVFDRWKLISGSVAITAEGLTLNGTIQQTIPNAIGSRYVATVLTSAGIVAGAYNPSTRVFTITSDGSAKIRAAKLEIGDYQTLAHQDGSTWVLNDIPNYSDELFKCQQYFYRFKPDVLSAFTFGVGACVRNTGNPTPADPNVEPTKYTSTIIFYGELGVPFSRSARGTLGANQRIYCLDSSHLGSSAQQITSITELTLGKNGALSGNVSITAASLTDPRPVATDKVCFIQTRSQDTYIDFSAEI